MKYLVPIVEAIIITWTIISLTNLIFHLKDKQIYNKNSLSEIDIIVLSKFSFKYKIDIYY